MRRSPLSVWKRVAAAALGALSVSVGCRQIAGLDGIQYDDKFCNYPADCDDSNPCTEEVCSPDAVCGHVDLANGAYPDGVKGNCLGVQCVAGTASPLDAPEDVDDGDDCTDDACLATGASHEVHPGAPCAFHGATGTCSPAGECVADCGYPDQDGVEVGCPPASSACELSYCDKASGQCVHELLDGVAAPGTTPGDCGGSYCVQGQLTDIASPVGADCLRASGLPGKCDASGACVECVTGADCDDGIPESECHQWVCMAGACANTTEPNGPLPSQVPGDCHTKTCNSGFFQDKVDNNDPKVDGNECTWDVCNSGVPLNPPMDPYSSCGAGGLLYCDGSGVCKGCLDDSQCTGGTDCKSPYCAMPAGDCMFNYAPAGVLTSAQSGGDCTDNVCDGSGNIVQVFQPADPKNDGKDCTKDVCASMGITTHDPVSAGSTCNDNGGNVCDAAAHCVGDQCFSDFQCPPGTSCVDGMCCDSACTGACMACTGSKKGGGPSGLCGPIAAGDPDNECPGGSSCSAGACQPLPVGSPCSNVPGECASGACADGVCCDTLCAGTCQRCDLAGSVGVCTFLPFGQDPDGECNGGACDGSGVCKLGQGVACAAGAQCASGNCVDGVCCNMACAGTCQACVNSKTGQGNGTCANITGQTDPDNECPSGACNGNGQCRLDPGQPCAAGGECLTGICTDAVCCMSNCAGFCRACNLVGSVGTCVNIPLGQDPSNECTGAAVCNGNGNCAAGPNGAACGAAGECASGNCVDGVCCNSACNGLCVACSSIKTGQANGACSPIPAGTDPDNECTLATPNCDGAGLCGP